MKFRSELRPFSALTSLLAVLPLVMVMAAPDVSAAQAEPPATPSISSAPAVVVRVVTVDGVRALKARTVVAAAAKEAVGHPGDHATIQAATKAVNALYRQRGYPVAQVVDADVTPDGTLKLEIAEGRVRRIIVRGNKKTRSATVLEALGTRTGDAYNTGAIHDDRNRLARLGLFEDVTITAQIPGAIDQIPPGFPRDKSDKDGKDGKASKDEKTDEGPAGGSATSPPPASGEAGAKSGAPTGAAGTSAPEAGGSVVTVAKPDAPDMPQPAEPLLPGEDRVGDVDLVVRVQERQTANIAATVGYANSIGAVGFVDLSEANLAGTGQRVAAQWQRASSSYIDQSGDVQRGDSRQAVSFSYEHPALGLRSTAWSVDLYDQNTVFLPSFTGVNYTIRTFETRNGATGRIGHALNRRLTGYLTLRHDDVGYDYDALYNANQVGDDPLSLPPSSLISNASGTVGAVGAILIADGRDTSDNPRRGYLNSLTIEDSTRALGGNRLFQQGTLDLRAYMPLSPGKTGPVFATRLLTGLSTGDVPLPEMYFIGGYEMLRGYELYSVYGDRMVLGSAELRAPLSEGVQGVAFVDAGNAWLPGQTFGSGGVKAGAGIGLRFLSPIGPIRFDAAYGDQFRTYISLGQSF